MIILSSLSFVLIFCLSICILLLIIININVKKALLSGGMDCKILLWNSFGDCNNYDVLTGHKKAITEAVWSSDSSKIISASADATCLVFDTHTGQRMKKCQGHKKCVNSVSSYSDNIASGNLFDFLSGSDDCNVNFYDFRNKYAVGNSLFQYPVTSVQVGRSDTTKAYVGSLDGNIYVLDIRKNKNLNNNNNKNNGDDSAIRSSFSNNIVDVYQGHGNIVTGLAVSFDGNYLLSNSLDNTLRIWDIRPYFTSVSASSGNIGGITSNNTNNRNIKLLTGHRHGNDKNLLRCSWSSDDRLVSCGSADQVVHIWDTQTGEELYALPGHKGTVNEVIFHPTSNEPIVASCSSDKTIILGELV